MAEYQQQPKMTAEETALLIEGWLRTTPDLSFKQVRKDAGNLRIPVSPRQYSEAKRRLGITAAPPRPTPPKASERKGRPMNRSAVARTPLMSFVVEFLRNKPGASYQETKTAGAAAGFQIAPINFGNARRMLGLSESKPRPRRTRAGRRAEIRSADAAARHPAGPARRGRRKLDFDNLSNLVAELQDVVAERDRLLEALDRISAIIRGI